MTAERKWAAKNDARYTDAPPEIDEAFEYAIKHNTFYTKSQIDELLNRKSQPVRRTLRKTAAMA
jgi:hypothetical protein